MTKAELEKYIPAKLELEQLEREESYWYAQLERCTRALTLTPRCGGQDPYPEVITRIDRLRHKQLKHTERLLGLRDRMEDALEMLGGWEAVILRARYIEGLTMWRISQKVGYSESQVKRIHESGLRKILSEKSGAAEGNL